MASFLKDLNFNPILGAGVDKLCRTLRLATDGKRIISISSPSMLQPSSYASDMRLTYGAVY
jgi:hypothetical protein